MSGGFYRYRCKYFMSHKCQEWVWVNGATCQKCVADGRDDIDAGQIEETWSSGTGLSHHALVPNVRDRGLQYHMRDIAAPTAPVVPRRLDEDLEVCGVGAGETEDRGSGFDEKLT